MFTDLINLLLSENFMYSEVACLRHCWFDPLPVINFFLFIKLSLFIV